MSARKLRAQPGSAETLDGLEEGCLCRGAVAQHATRACGEPQAPRLGRALNTVLKAFECGRRPTVVPAPGPRLGLLAQCPCRHEELGGAVARQGSRDERV